MCFKNRQWPLVVFSALCNLSTSNDSCTCVLARSRGGSSVSIHLMAQLGTISSFLYNWPWSGISVYVNNRTTIEEILIRGVTNKAHIQVDTC